MLSNKQASCNVQDIDNMIIDSDFNTDLARTDYQNTPLLNSFVTGEDLRYCISLDISNVQYPYESDVTGTGSIIVHFIVSQNLSKYVLDYICLIMRLSY